MFDDPRFEFVAGNEPIGASRDRALVHEQHEKRDAPDLEPFDQRRVVPGVHLSDRDVEFACYPPSTGTILLQMPQPSV